MISAIVDELAPDLIAGKAIGYEPAAQLLITAGDNPDRLKSEASFAALCGVNPIPASSGKVNRHRLNRGGDGAANSAPHIIAIGRLRIDARTKEYVEKRLTQGHTKLEALRCVKPVSTDLGSNFDLFNNVYIVCGVIPSPSSISCSHFMKLRTP